MLKLLLLTHILEKIVDHEDMNLALHSISIGREQSFLSAVIGKWFTHADVIILGFAMFLFPLWAECGDIENNFLYF
ncbi:hypothetical protein ACJX0J_037605, partial [Zea mays]